MRIFTHLKNTDLACMSALNIIKQQIKNPCVTSLSRYKVWDITCEGDEKEQLNILVDQSYHIVNPNKEHYFIDRIPVSHDPSLTYIPVEVKPLLEQKNEALIKQLNLLQGVTITEMVSGTLWVIGCNASLSPDSDLESYILDTIVLSTQRKKGLLVNPIFESAKVLQSSILFSEAKPA